MKNKLEYLLGGLLFRQRRGENLMTKYLVREHLTETEIETLTELENNGTEIYPAPIEITSTEQLKSLGITRDDCVTWRIGTDKVLVHLTPAPKAVAEFLLGDLRTEHSSEYQKKRCMIPGERKPLVFCPDRNKCSSCPHPEYREQHRANNFSYEQMLANGYDESYSDHAVREFMILDELDEALKAIRKKDPKYAMAIYLRRYIGLSREETAKQMCVTPRAVDYFEKKARLIGKQFREEYEG